MADTAPHPRVAEPCLNCGTVVEQEYCPACGQHWGDYRRSTWRLLGDLLREVLEVDGRVWRTFVAMLRPGKLTREFNRGRRRRYMSPVRLYLFVSVVMFAVAGISIRLDMMLDPESLELDEGAPPDPSSESSEPPVGPTPTEPASSRTRVQTVDEPTLDRWQPQGALERAIKRRMVELARMSEAELTKELVEGALSYGPLVMFCLLPIYALLLKLMFIGTRWLYIDHLVFSLHVHTVWFLALLGSMVVESWMNGTLLLVVVLLPAGYTVAALRHAYFARWWTSALRALGLLLTYSFALSVGMTLALGAGALLG